MHPISEERANWIRDRLVVIEESLRIGKASMYGGSGPGHSLNELQQAVLELGTERTRLSLELRVLNELVAGQVRER